MNDPPKIVHRSTVGERTIRRQFESAIGQAENIIINLDKTELKKETKFVESCVEGVFDDDENFGWVKRAFVINDDQLLFVKERIKK